MAVTRGLGHCPPPLNEWQGNGDAMGEEGKIGVCLEEAGEGCVCVWGGWVFSVYFRETVEKNLKY